MYRASFCFRIPKTTSDLPLGEFVSDYDDPIRALNEARDKRPAIAQALTMTMPHFGNIRPGQIEIHLTVHNPQLLLFDVPNKQDTEVLEDEEGLEMFLADAIPTLTTVAK